MVENILSFILEDYQLRRSQKITSEMLHKVFVLMYLILQSPVFCSVEGGSLLGSVLSFEREQVLVDLIMSYQCFTLQSAELYSHYLLRAGEIREKL